MIMKQFCINGHDTFICGRKKMGRCRTCCQIENTTRMQRLRKRGRKLIASIKDRPCTDCDIKYPPYIMQFDHLISTEKRQDVSDMDGYSIELILKEIQKCELVCANCHAERTHRRKQKNIKEPQNV